jgi:hypothetical protein
VASCGRCLFCLSRLPYCLWYGGAPEGTVLPPLRANIESDIQGQRITHMVVDEGGSSERRHLILEREDGTTYSADVPADCDLGEVLGEGDMIVTDLQWGDGEPQS